MEALDEYNSSSPIPESKDPVNKIIVNPAPLSVPEASSIHQQLQLQQTQTFIEVNLPLSHLSAPLLGPENPLKLNKLKNANMITGHISREFQDDVHFETQYRKHFDNDYGLNSEHSVKDERRIHNQIKRQKRQNRLPKGDPAVVEGENSFRGPWADYEGELFNDTLGPAVQEFEHLAQPHIDAQNKNGQLMGNEYSEFHGEEEKDYMGRTYMHVPQDLGIDLNKTSVDINCFLPKKIIHTWKGHTKGVSRVRLFPKHGHLLLSSSVDKTVKIWDVYHDRLCLRTYHGHTKAVKDIAFNHDGTKFVSSSYDRYIKLWDTETGKCLGQYTSGKTALCLLFYPGQEHENMFLAGHTDKRILQYDINTGQMVNQYTYHLGAVNQMLFVEENKRFVSTSDDKSIRTWEFNVPIVVRYLQEPYLYSHPAIALHPNKRWIACQSLDNFIYVFGARDKYKINTKKKFGGHMVLGNACQVEFSNDGRFVISGDSQGFFYVWDWKTCKLLK